MEKYFYIKNFSYWKGTNLIDQLLGYYTDAGHNYFFPCDQISREDALRMVKNGEVLFVNDGCYRQLKVKLLKINEVEYLRIDHYKQPFDFLG
jgi:hypothetical protein